MHTPAATKRRNHVVPGVIHRIKALLKHVAARGVEPASIVMADREVVFVVSDSRLVQLLAQLEPDIQVALPEDFREWVRKRYEVGSLRNSQRRSLQKYGGPPCFYCGVSSHLGSHGLWLERVTTGAGIGAGLGPDRTGPQ